MAARKKRAKKQSARKKTARGKTARRKTTPKRTARARTSRAEAPRRKDRARVKATRKQRVSKRSSCCAHGPRADSLVDSPDLLGPRLLHLVSDLTHDRSLRQSFNRNPGAVMDDYQLTDAEKYCLYTMDPELVADLIYAEVESFTLETGEFQPIDENCFPDPQLQQPAYPDPDPLIHRIKPKMLTAGDTDVEFIVYGQSFPPDSNVRLTRQGVSHDYDGFVFGTHRCSRIRVVIDVVPAAGTYDVVVFGNHAAAPIYRVTTPAVKLVVSQ